MRIRIPSRLSSIRGGTREVPTATGPQGAGQYRARVRPLLLPWGGESQGNRPWTSGASPPKRGRKDRPSQADPPRAATPRTPRPSAAFRRQPERGHLLAVAYQQCVPDQHRMVPGLALDGRESRNLRELVGGRPDQRQLTLLRHHQQQILIGQQDELAAAVASALPLAGAVLEVDAREGAAVEAVGMVPVYDEVVEVGTQPVRRPALADGPAAGPVRDPEAADAEPAGAAGRADQDVAARDQRRLHAG